MVEGTGLTPGENPQTSQVAGRVAEEEVTISWTALLRASWVTTLHMRTHRQRNGGPKVLTETKYTRDGISPVICDNL